MKLNSHTKPKLAGRRSQCPTCELGFTSNSAFDMHRVGAFGSLTDPRRCMTVKEMTVKGMGQSADGFWTTGTFWVAGSGDDAED